MADLTKKDIRNTLLSSLKSVLAKREKEISDLRAKELKGLAKLEKKPSVQKDEGVLPNLGKMDPPMAAVPPPNAGVATPMDMAEAPMTCDECGSKDHEPLGEHRGMSHHFCKGCGGIMAKSVANMAKVTPPDIGEKTMHDLKDEYGHDKAGKEKAYATAWSIHNQNQKSKKLEKAATTVESARQAVGVAGAMPKAASVAKLAVPAQRKVTDSFNRGDALGKAEKTPFNDGGGTCGKPHEVIPGVDVGMDVAQPGTVPPSVGKDLDRKGSGGQVTKGQTAKAPLIKDDSLLPTAKNPSIVPTVREKGNAKKGLTSVATIRQRWHGKGNMDAHDLATALRPVFDKLPHLKQHIAELEQIATKMPKKLPDTQISTGNARGQHRIGSVAPGTGGFAAVDQKAQSMGKAEIPAAPKAPGSKPTGVSPPPVKAPVQSPISTTKGPANKL
jgi:hypothetical protein